MREHKFRGKRLDNGVWVYGDLIQYADKSCAIFSSPLSKYGYEATEICKRDAVDPSTIGEFTGLLDKNGASVFEGDILAYIPNEKLKQKIGWEAKYAAGDMFFDLCGFCLRAKGNNGDTRYISYPDFIPDEMEIVGNIHEKKDGKL